VNNVSYSHNTVTATYSFKETFTLKLLNTKTKKMKKVNFNTMKKYFFIAVMAGSMSFVLNSCAKKTAAVGKTETATMTETPGTSVMPENKGVVQIKRDVNSNYVVQINLIDLKEVSGVKPDAKSAYIVWMDADMQMTKSLGQISSNTGWFSDKSQASFEASSVFKPTKVFITEETDATVQKPGLKVIWATSKF